MKDSFYFSHDYNARNDIKIKQLLQRHGMTGYGVYWSIIEELYNNANALPTDYDTIAYELRVESDMVKSIVNDFDLFVIDGQEFGSSSVERRLNERAERSRKASDSANSRWEQYRRNANAMRTHSEGNAIKERKGNEKKEKETKGKETVDGDVVVEVWPTFDDFWNLYDKKTDRAKCENKWNKLKQEDKEAIMDYLPAYKQSTPDKKYRRNPETFLNNKTWENEIIDNSTKNNRNRIPQAGSFTLADFGYDEDTFS